jgi:hypothetical protein
MRKPRIYSPVIMDDHINYESGKAKTVCVTACLTALGVPFDSFKVTGTLAKPNKLAILRGTGYNVRSRKSKMPKGLTIGACRKAIDRLDEEAIYLVTVNGSGYCHSMLLDSNGQTIVDTAPRRRDRRKVHSIYAVFSS